MKKNIDNEICKNIFAIYRLIRKKFGLIKKINLTMIQLHGLIFIKENENSHLTDLAKSFSITLSTANNLVNRLVNLNLVKKESGQKDQRVIKLSITKKGKDLIKRLVKERKKIFSNVINRLTQDEKEKLLIILKKIIS